MNAMLITIIDNIFFQRDGVKIPFATFNLLESLYKHDIFTYIIFFLSMKYFCKNMKYHRNKIRTLFIS